MLPEMGIFRLLLVLVEQWCLEELVLVLKFCPIDHKKRGVRGRTSLEVFKTQIRQGMEQAGLVEGVPAHGRESGAGWASRSLQTQAIPGSVSQ